MYVYYIRKNLQKSNNVEIAFFVCFRSIFVRFKGANLRKGEQKLSIRFRSLKITRKFSHWATLFIIYTFRLSFLFLNCQFFVVVILARDGGRMLQNISPEQRSSIIETYAESLVRNSKAILDANKIDMELARKNCNFIVTSVKFLYTVCSKLKHQTTS